MTIEEQTQNVKFCIDKRGRKTHAVLPLKDYEKLLEDLRDLALGLERKDEKDIAMEEAFKFIQNEADPSVDQKLISGRRRIR